MTSVCILFALSVVAIFVVSWIVSDRRFDQDMKQRDEERLETAIRLTNSLKTLCSQLGIEVSYHKELGDAAGRILYHSRAGRLLLDDAKIEILEKYENEPWVLAHELGHYMAIKQRQDDTESGADAEAYKLCCLILNQHEQELLSIALFAHFERHIKAT